MARGRKKHHKLSKHDREIDMRNLHKVRHHKRKRKMA